LQLFSQLHDLILPFVSEFPLFLPKFTDLAALFTFLDTNIVKLLVLLLRLRQNCPHLIDTYLLPESIKGILKMMKLNLKG
jgi:hypothetical protein